MTSTVLITEAVLAAVTDGTDQLRYLPNDDIHPILAARRETSERHFIALMRRFVLPHRTTDA